MYPKGSEWRKWDLHVHTPFTKLNNSYGNPDDCLYNFCEVLNNSDIKVFGITDYFNVDTFFEFKKKFNKIYPESDKTFIPNVEFRIDSKNSRNEHIQIHVLFSPDLSENNLKEFFTRLKLVSTDNINLTNKYCNDNNLNEVGYDKAMVRIEDLKKQLESDFTSENYLIIGVVNGYGSLRPHANDGRGAEYAKELDKICHAFFGNKDNVDFYLNKIPGRSRYNLPPKPVLLASDCHSFNDLDKKLGNCFTWIKADPTFEGLRQIIYEPEERVFIGDEQTLLKRVRENKTKFIKTINVKWIDGYNGEKGTWFKKIDIPLNPGMVAIIGNRGSGKSALADIIALCGNSHLYEEFSFLKKDRFLKDNLAGNFEATLSWVSENDVITKRLNEPTDKNSPERVRYLPQSFFEKLTNNLELYEFNKTIEQIVFSYIPEEQRLGKKSFEEITNYKKDQGEKQIEKKENSLNELNKKIIELERKLHPSYKQTIEEKKKLKEKELDEHKKNKPKEVPNPKDDPNISEELINLQSDIEKLNEDLKKVDIEIEETKKKRQNILLSIEELSKIKNELKDFEQSINSFLESKKDILNQNGLSIKELITINIKYGVLESKVTDLNDEYKSLGKKLSSPSEIVNITDEAERNNAKQVSLLVKKEEIERKINELKSKISEPQKKYQKYLEDLKKWEDKKKEIDGDEQTQDSLNWLKTELKFIEKKLNSEIEILRTQRLEICKQIYDIKKGFLDIYKEFNESANKKISEFQNILGEYKISIDVALKIDTNFYDEFLKYINQNKKGSFYGEDEGKEILISLVKNKNLNDKDEFISLMKSFIEYLEEDKRENIEKEKDKRRFIKDQIIKEDKWLEFYNYLFSLNYIIPEYKLTLGDKDISQLSPGEKGALLIVFYLLLDKDDIPLIIDQPEENLDNESVYKILRHFNSYAKKQRQIIMVTHNPNLAVVGDAEQIIYVTIDKKNNNTFEFKSGAIENQEINKHASDILEGTLKAFDIRRLKYLTK